jgi:dTDP-4-amino-4,6-dideoxygalactose transaminase
MQSKQITLGSVSITDIERKYVNQVLDSTLVGPFEFSKRVASTVANLHGFKFGRYLNSGQSALTIALRSIIQQRGWTHRPLVATPACTYISTQAACIFAGCDFCLIDVGLDDINMDPKCLLDQLEYQKLLGRPIDIIMPVHLCGKPVKEEIKDICKLYNLPSVVDSCETIFAPKNLDWGTIVCFSTFSNHTIGAGAGGVTATNDEQLDFFMFQQISHGRENESSGSDPHTMGKRFRFSEWGESLKPSDLYAAVALGAIDRREEIIKAQRENAELLTAMLASQPLMLPTMDNHTFMFYPIITKEYVNTDRLLTYLHDNGIFTRRLMPITNQPVVLKYIGYNQSHMNSLCPNAAYINKHGFYVGSHPGLKPADILYLGQKICAGISEVLR